MSACIQPVCVPAYLGGLQVVSLFPQSPEAYPYEEADLRKGKAEMGKRKADPFQGD